MQRAALNYPVRFSTSGGGETVGIETTFSSLFRLSDPADFDRVFRENQRSVDDFFTVLYRSNGLAYSRLGLAIARKRVRRAVARNRLKRVIRESFRGVKRQLKGLDIVIMAERKAESALNKELFVSLDRHWQSLDKHTKH